MKQFLQRILQEVMKKIILGTSDTWSTSHLSQLTSKPANQRIILQIVGFLKGLQDKKLVTLVRKKIKLSLRGLSVHRLSKVCR